MRMRRNVLWGCLALYPLVGLLVVANLFPESFITEDTTSPTLLFIEQYWFAAFLATCILQFAYFIFHAASSGVALQWRRPLWISGFLLLGFAATPLYWWLYSEK